jgi:hypothetical protein
LYNSNVLYSDGVHITPQLNSLNVEY